MNAEQMRQKAKSVIDQKELDKALKDAYFSIEHAANSGRTSCFAWLGYCRGTTEEAFYSELQSKGFQVRERHNPNGKQVVISW